MQTKNDLTFRRKNDEIVVKQASGKSISFPNAKRAYHSKDDVVVITAMGGPVRVNKYLSKEC